MCDPNFIHWNQPFRGDVPTKPTNRYFRSITAIVCMKKTLTTLLTGAALLGLTASTALAQPLTITLDPIADTFTRVVPVGDPHAGTNGTLSVNGNNSPDDVAYIKFDVSAVKTVVNATFGIVKGNNDGSSMGSMRNDTVESTRFRNWGLLNLPGNTPQDWDELAVATATNVLTDAGFGAEYTNTAGVQVDFNQLFNLDANAGANVTEDPQNNSTTHSTLTGPDLNTFIDQRVADGGLLTFMTIIDANNRGFQWFSREHTDTALRPYLEIEYIPETGLSNISWGGGDGTWDVASTASWEDQVGGSKVYGPEATTFGNDVMFDDSSSGASPITVTLDATVQPTSVAMNSSKDYTITGFGDIKGPGTITKSGTGTLKIEIFNFGFTGPWMINEGTVSFDDTFNLGDGFGGASLNFDGGTLHWAPGNSADITFDFVNITFNAGGATFDVGANSPFFGDPVGNDGSGSFTKKGTGTLALGGGVQGYTGDTIVSEGALDVQGVTLQSPTILVEGAGTLQAAFSSYTLNTTNSQLLAGTGDVLTELIVPGGTTVSPGESIGTLTFGSGIGDGGLTLDGGTLAIEISTNGTLDFADVKGLLQLNSGFVEVATDGIIGNGNYRIMDYDSLGGDLGSFLVLGFDQPGQVAFLSDAINGQINLVVTPLGTNDLVWAGTSPNWDVGTSTSWTDGSPQVFQQADQVTFNDSGAAQPDVLLTGSIIPGSLTVEGTTDYTFAGAGKLIGTAGIQKEGTGTLTISNANVNTGATIIQGGTILVGAGGALGAGDITVNGSLVTSQDSDTSSGLLVGTGDVTVQGAGTLTLTGGATHTGATTISSGGLILGDGGALPPVATSAIANNGLFGVNSSSDVTLAAPVTGLGAISKSGAGTLTLSTGQTFGDLSLSDGILVLGDADQATGAWDLLVGTLDLGGFDQSATGLTGEGTISGGSGGNNTLTLNIDTNAAGTFSGFINDGSNNVFGLVKTGAGVISRGNNNDNSGDYSGGTLIVGPGGFNIDGVNQLGTGLITMDGGFITQGDQNQNTNSYHILTTALFEGRGNTQLRGPGVVTGPTNAILNFESTAGLFSLEVDMHGFYGTVMYGGPNPVGARMNGGVGSSNAVWNINTNDTTFNSRNGGLTVHMGHLIQDSGGTFTGATSVDDGTTYSIGNLNLDIDFDGTMTDAANFNQWMGLTKVGTGTMTLSGTNIDYTGPTAVNGGSLVVAGGASLDNSRDISVATGATLDLGAGGTLTLGNSTNALVESLGGGGTVIGNVVADDTSGAIIAPGDSAGELTITGDITLAAGTVVNMELDNSATPKADLLTAANINEAGTLNVTNIGPALAIGQKFTLFSEPVSAFTTVNLPTSDPTGTYTWTDNLAVDGTITVLTAETTIPLTPTNITWSVDGTNLNLGWPADYTGWVLQSQTNTLDVGISTNWVVVPGSQATNMVSIPLNDVDPAVFYRMSLP